MRKLLLIKVFMLASLIEANGEFEEMDFFSNNNKKEIVNEREKTSGERTEASGERIVNNEKVIENSIDTVVDSKLSFIIYTYGNIDELDGISSLIYDNKFNKLRRQSNENKRSYNKELIYLEKVLNHIELSDTSIDRKYKYLEEKINILPKSVELNNELEKRNIISGLYLTLHLGYKEDFILKVEESKAKTYLDMSIKYGNIIASIINEFKSYESGIIIERIYTRNKEEYLQKMEELLSKAKEDMGDETSFRLINEYLKGFTSYIDTRELLDSDLKPTDEERKEYERLRSVSNELENQKYFK